MPSSAVRTLVMIKLGAMVLAGGAAALLGWVIADRLAFAIEQQERTIASLSEPARTLLGTPLLAAAPGVVAMTIALLGLAVPRLRTMAIVFATLVMLAAVVALVTTLVQVLGPMYEMQRIGVVGIDAARA